MMCWEKCQRISYETSKFSSFRLDLNEAEGKEKKVTSTFFFDVKDIIHRATLELATISLTLVSHFTFLGYSRRWHESEKRKEKNQGGISRERIEWKMLEKVREEKWKTS